MRGVDVAESLHPAPERGSPGIVVGHHREFVGDDLHVMEGIAKQGTEQIILVREIEVKGPVGCVRAPDNVLYASRLQSRFVKFSQASLE
jgi:hypothetical protein